MRRSIVQAIWLAAALLATLPPAAWTAQPETTPPEPAGKRVYVVPIRDDIMPPMVYLVRRGVKQAMDAQADLLVVDMDTNGGRADSMETIIEILGQFKGQTVTFVRPKAYSAGALISFATQRIYMAPQAVIGAAAVIAVSPGGTGVEQMPDTVELKMTSAISARIRAQAQKNGHNSEVVEAMMDKQKELIIDGQTINPKGKILTLTNVEAEKNYGDPPKPLLSAGTVENLTALFDKLGFAGAQVTTIAPTGAEKIASWINALNWLWLMIGAAGIYIEFKTPGFGLPGIVGICAFALYFLGSYVAGLAGWEWPALFVLGLVLVILELFVFPGVVILGLTGAGLMLITLVMAMVDLYPGMPAIPTLPQLTLPLRDLTYAFLGTIVLLLVLSRFLPKTSVYHALVSHSASGMASVQHQASTQTSQVGLEGVALSVLRPGGKAQFGETVLDVITQGELLSKGTRVRIIAHSGTEAVVEECPQTAPNAPQPTA